MIPHLPVAEDVTLAARSAEDRIQSGSADIQIDAIILLSPNPGETTQPQPAIGHYDAVSTFHNDFCDERLPMLCSGCLELTTKNCRE